jgi:hypothetical protein
VAEDDVSGTGFEVQGDIAQMSFFAYDLIDLLKRQTHEESLRKPSPLGGGRVGSITVCYYE